MSPLKIETKRGWRIVPEASGGPTVQTPIRVGPGEEILLHAQDDNLQHSAVNFLGKDLGGQAGTHEVKFGETFDTADLRTSVFHTSTEGFIVTGT